MTKWIAKTNTGTTYNFSNGRVRIISRSGVEKQYFMAWYMKIFDLSETDGMKTVKEILAHLHTLPDNDTPEVGKNIYVGGKDEWRISTPVVEITFLEDE